MKLRATSDLQRQLAEIESGNRDDVHLYDTPDTDELLATISRTKGVHSLFLELTDVSIPGFEHIALMPELRTLTVYGGRHGLTDEGLAILAKNPAIEDLRLINTRVTNSGLRSLHEFKSLRRLLLFYDGANEPPITDAALMELKKVERLEKIWIGGVWASTAAVSGLPPRFEKASADALRKP